MRDWEREFEITTPESVALQQRTAGPGTRFLALLIDLLLVFFLISFVEYIVLLLLTIVAAGSGPSDQNQLFASIVVLVSVGVGFLIFFGYWFVMETWFGGQTIGKKALGIRAVMKGGFPLTASASLTRNLVRLVDMIPPPLFFVGLVSMALSKKYQRLGDHAAGTLVVRDRSHRDQSSGFFFAGLHPSQVSHWDTSGISNRDLELIRRFLARRTSLSGAARYTLGLRLARRYHPIVTGDDPAFPPEVFLEGIVLERQVRSTRLPQAS